MDNLSFDLLVFYSFFDSFLWDVFSIDSFNWGIVNISVSVNVWDIFGLVLNSLIVSLSSFVWNIFNSLDGFVFNVGSFIWDIFNSGFSSYWGLLSNNGRYLSLWGYLLDNWSLDERLRNWSLVIWLLSWVSDSGSN